MTEEALRFLEPTKAYDANAPVRTGLVRVSEVWLSSRECITGAMKGTMSYGV